MSNFGVKILLLAICEELLSFFNEYKDEFYSEISLTFLKKVLKVIFTLLFLSTVQFLYEPLDGLLKVFGHFLPFTNFDKMFECIANPYTWGLVGLDSFFLCVDGFLNMLCQLLEGLEGDKVLLKRFVWDISSHIVKDRFFIIFWVTNEGLPSGQ